MADAIQERSRTYLNKYDELKSQRKDWVSEWEDMGYEPRPGHINDEIAWYINIKNKSSSEGFWCHNWAQTLNQMGYFHQYHIPANKETQNTMIEYYKSWWADHIIAKKPPEPKYYEDIKRIWTAPVGTIIADNQLERWCKEYKDIGKELGKKGFMAKRKNELKVLILKEMKKMDSMIDDDSRDKTILRNKTGDKLISYSGKVFR